MSDNNFSKKTASSQSFKDFPEDQLEAESTKSRYDFAEFARKRNSKNKDLKLRASRERKEKSRAA